MSAPAGSPTPEERVLITAAGLDATFAAHPAEVLGALRTAAAMRERLIRPQNAAEEPAITFRPPVAP
ncbi:hypothetical protein [Roseomonas chloroacetimidivorans]|uniref:hypothetical protein n=1 Tax=Roseomonas chloroacetimidivorans TaxID=1766656 RepID=UPI003C76E394